MQKTALAWNHGEALRAGTVPPPPRFRRISRPCILYYGADYQAPAVPVGVEPPADVEEASAIDESSTQIPAGKPPGASLT